MTKSRKKFDAAFKAKIAVEARLRGPSGAKDEFLLAATAQNLRKLARLIPLTTPVFAT